MTLTSIHEYADAKRGHYLKASKNEKGIILDEFISVTGCHRKAAIRLLRHKLTSEISKKRGRPRQYGIEVTSALKTVWEAGDHLCSKRLQPFIPELIAVLARKGEIKVSIDIRNQLLKLSPSTIDRLLLPYRKPEGRRSLSTTKPGSLLKNAIPIRTFTDWEDTRPGFLEADLVAHCGESVEGFYLNTLSTVDVATGWSECVGVWGKGQERVGGGVHHVKERLPFPLLGLDSDNGSEFINQHLFEYCRRWHITFTRSRSYKKNDNCYIEQKNWSVVRRLIGYDRYSSKQAFEALNRIYFLLRLYINYFQPVMKLISKTRHGSRVHKIYDKAQTPYQRLLNSGILSEANKQQLAASYQGLNPVLLLKQINEGLKHLWKLADRPVKQNKNIEDN
jgi:hypothetical protein